ncbi:MAG: DNA-formamidopyrimidine glycosylase [Cyanobacteria bacterium]|nr:DNA-formamidopyrimidine glycosylase [Cyanobacteriota bacterium]
MPELPEVETVRRGLQQQVDGFVVQRVCVLRSRAVAAPKGDPDGFAAALSGCRINDWQRRGKYLMAKLSKGCSPAGELGAHLRMTGQFQWLKEGEKPPCAHTRVQFWGHHGPHQEARELRFVDLRSFGELWYVPFGAATEQVITGLQRLGPEPFNSTFNATYLKQRFKGSSRPIKNALLDQAVVAGVGNIYADESLFLAGIQPHNPSGTLSLTQLKQLHSCLLEVLQASIGVGGTSFSDFRDLKGNNGNYGGAAWVYRRGGEPCRKCGTPLRRDKLGGRSSHWCPTCQQ